MSFEISQSCENLPDDGFSAPEERATFGMLCVNKDGIFLTEGFSDHQNRPCKGPMTAGAPLAEWLAWNWWRLTYEPQLSEKMRRLDEDADIAWGMAHCMASAGDGYVWPDISVFSDGLRTTIVSEPSKPDAVPYRYLNAHRSDMPTEDWINAVDAYMSLTIGRLSGAGLKNANVSRLWESVVSERDDPKTAKIRRVQALMGHEPDNESDEDAVLQLIADTDRLGEKAVDEIAAGQAYPADTDTGASLPATAEEFEAAAKSSGFDASVKDSPVFDISVRADHNKDAWRVGYEAAQSLRKLGGDSDGPIEDKTLAEFTGAQSDSVRNGPALSGAMSFYLENADKTPGGRLVLRQKRHDNRRFALARLIGDRILHSNEGLSPALDSETYRQKFQRAFAGELLCPIHVIENELDHRRYNDEERRDELAEHYGVSSMVVGTKLMNHGHIEREYADTA